MTIAVKRPNVSELVRGYLRIDPNLDNQSLLARIRAEHGFTPSYGNVATARKNYNTKEDMGGSGYKGVCRLAQAILKENPELTSQELAKRVKEKHGFTPSITAIYSAKYRFSRSRKRKNRISNNGKVESTSYQTNYSVSNTTQVTLAAVRKLKEAMEEIGDKKTVIELVNTLG